MRAAGIDVRVRNRQVIADVAAALAQCRNCLVLTNWTAHLGVLADALRGLGYDPVILRGGMGARDRAAVVARLQPQPGGPPVLVVATGPYADEGFDCPALAAREEFGVWGGLGEDERQAILPCAPGARRFAAGRLCRRQSR